MELELGLALPNQGQGNVLDLNSCSNEMQIDETRNNKYRHRCVDDGEEEEEEVESKSSLSWSGQYHDPKWTNNLHLHVHENEDIIGWPLINSSSLHQLHHHHEHEGGGGVAVAPAMRNYLYVKVKMEGVAIGRKIDLTLYDSYQSLTDSLFHMFAKYIKNDGSSSSRSNYRILYQDTEGDWMLAGDVPWGAFVESVQRMKILRSTSN